MNFPYQSLIPQNEDERFMLEALKEAWKAFQADEVPIGAVLVKEKRVIARGHNQVELLQDATAHAEILCITSGETVLENWRLSNTTLYCTIEPCCMCAGAILLSRVDNLVWGAPDIRHGANGSWIDVFLSTHPTHTVNIKQNILKEPCAALIKDFFSIQRTKRERKNVNDNISYQLGINPDLP